MNKSQFVVDNMDPIVLKVAKDLIKDWAGRLYQQHFATPSTPVDESARNLKRAIAKLKQMWSIDHQAANEQFWYMADAFDEFSDDESEE